MRRHVTKKKVGSLNILSIAGVRPYECKSNEQYMNSAQIDHFKRILEAWRDQLRVEIQESPLYMRDEVENFPDPIDRAVQEEEFNIELRNRDRGYKLIKKIENTIKKLERSSFGFCESCDVEIGIRRLEASPIADLCIDCKILSEMREKQIIG
ncbi:RNA polymerase-binding protein DksA [Blochmannia endosymbiont of Polyrhachis (Hedomyrma) turneri]|uniref:RNA polymerase-binding protein DksA n=1 Tax=Blochmannia endosymbiont of Polyrhachis (Hedomyrma) turneri TaxID=1505596 RepID=UPI00061A7F32|nr:RNA polymerase-binding protein DksA [Blochmannia endosymbiont of Polyrhachis (Hedomyrma) turneri]AKC59732.1 DnaK suppressor protein [Blochmannia endosymbiont of Polyrhachis (Hedomyrma) turneri]